MKGQAYWKIVFREAYCHTWGSRCAFECISKLVVVDCIWENEECSEWHPRPTGLGEGEANVNLRKSKGLQYCNEVD